MRAIDLIARKRDGGELSDEQIRFLVGGCVSGEIPDYQLSAFLMAVYWRGMTKAETVALTFAMAESGGQVDLTSIPGVKVDKHSTGGVGDKTTLVVAPLVAAAGVPIAKMSGRGLGHTGGTIDKLESIPGFRTELSIEEMLRQVSDIGIALVSQSEDLVPADRNLYALRDATATVESLPLIASSVMSKKLAAGADAIVLDVKCGHAAFIRTQQEADALAKLMVTIGRRAGRRTVALITSMDQPLGCAIGNALEVQEAIEALAGGGPDDLRDLSSILAGWMLALGGRASDAESGRIEAMRLLASGAGLAKLRELIAAQGGDAQIVDHPERLPAAPARLPLLAEQAGFVSALDARALGEAVMRLGGGRATQKSAVDHAVGIIVHAKVGDQVEIGQPLLTVHAREAGVAQQALTALNQAYTFAASKQPSRPSVLAVVS